MSRLSPGIVTIAILAILVGLGGAYAARYMLQEPPVASPPPRVVVRVPVASIDLPAGRVLKLGDISLMNRDELENIPDNTVGSTEYIIGRTLREPLQTGRPFITTSFYPEGSGPSLSSRLKPGMRAVAVSVDDLGLLGGHVEAGMMVDVMFRSSPRKGANGYDDIGEVTVKLLDAVEVLVVGDNPSLPQADAPANFGGPPKKLVSLACTPEQAAKLRAVEGRGDVSLALWSEEAGGRERQAHPVATSRSDGLTLEEVLHVGPRPEPFTTEIYRGGQRTVTTFQDRKLLETQVARDPATDAAPVQSGAPLAAAGIPDREP